MTTDILSIVELTEGQYAPYVTHNEALAKLEAVLVRVLSRTNSGPPAFPSNGDTYIVDSATGDWSDASVDDIAHYVGGGWEFYTPVEGMRLWCNDENTCLVYDGSDWIDMTNTAFIEVSQLGTPTYTTIQDLINITQSAGKISGGDITDNGDGTVTVEAGTGLIKTTDSDVGETKTFDWDEDSSVSLTDDAFNYIYVEYNSGSPQIMTSTTVPSDKNTNVFLGGVFRDGTDLHIFPAGQFISNYAKNTLWKDIEINGKFQRVNGIMISETGTRNIAITAGAYYAGLTKVTFSAFDSSGTDTFTYYYRDGGGGWTKVTSQSQIDNTHYDDDSGTLATLTTNRYGVHWVYVDVEGHIFIVYGQGNYKLTNAYNAQPPSSLPEVIASIGKIVGKIIIQKNASSFESIESAFDVYFVPQTVVDHNDLSGLQGGTSDEYYHLTADEHSARWLSSDGTNIYHNGNVGIGTSSYGTNANKVLSVGLGTAPTTAPADIVQIWAADLNGAGTCGLKMMDEGGNTFTIMGTASSQGVSTGAGSVLMNSANNANNAGWLEVTKDDGTTVYVPYWSTATP